MGFFGLQKVEPRAELSVLPEEEKKADLPPTPSRAGSTVIAQGITVHGTFKGEGVIQVEGVVIGEFDLTGAVIVAESGMIRGPVTANVVRIAGRVEGSVSAREHMRLEPTGSLDGDVTTASLVVEDGGSLNGRCTTIKPTPELGTVSGPEELQFGPEFEMEERA